ncbi:SDR family NAD(P)-dependent oxidoreductase [Pseudoroseicyclus sp. CXY001]|uniref:SDR family NAD(P)-dependent oxidoreductase n=1 Tax=Pseudoroseicyclus sp. CXY001 TaxID=3242492 RepID=UPI0035713758
MQEKAMRRTIILTGASDGIGAAAARQLAAAGHRLVLVGRSPEKTARVAAELGAPYHLADYARLIDVRRLADELAAYGPIDVLANNAGGIFNGGETTEDGFDKTIQVNHLAPFLLTSLLLPGLIENGASVIQTASAYAKSAPRLDLDSFAKPEGTSATRSYATSKMANVLFTRELHRRYHEEGLNAVAFHPGVLATNFASSTSSFFRFMASSRLVRLFLSAPEDGGARLAALVEGRAGADWPPGAFLSGTKEWTVRGDDDPALARALWERSEALLGLPPAP